MYGTHRDLGKGGIVFCDSLDLCKPSENKGSKILNLYHRQS
jgi:hypothetical protein